MKTRADVLKEIDAERAAWNALLAEIGEERMEEPGRMGDWSFKDLVAHLVFWGERTLARIEAGPDGDAPPPAWPAAVGAEDQSDDWVKVNAWIYEQYRDRPLREVLAEMDESFQRLATLIETMPEDDLMTPGRFGFDKPLIEGDFFGHFHDEHEASVRAWLQTG